MPSAGVEQVGAADQIVERADAQLRHDLAHFLGDEEEEVDDVLGLAREASAQHRILRGDADRAGVEVALAHHDAAVATSGAVAKPNSSAPSSAPMTTSRPVFIWPSACTRMRPRRRFSTRVCCVSARPSSHGVPACLIDDSGEAPVPPSWPAMTTWSALALATPAATVPTPDFGHQLHARCGRAGWRSSGRGSAAPGPRSNRCRGAAAARSGRRPAPSSAACRCTRITLWPGSWPPSPGFAPCAILIWIWSARDQVLGRDAEAARRDLLDAASAANRRPAAECRPRRRPGPSTDPTVSPVLIGIAAQFAAIAALGSSPPSPVLLLPPMRFIATASVACASVEIEPSDIAPVAKRLTISRGRFDLVERDRLAGIDA